MGWTPLSWGSPLNGSFRLGRPAHETEDGSTAPTVRSTACLELRVQAVSARKKEAFQRLSDLHQVVNIRSAPDDTDASVAELQATQCELETLSQQQYELEIALAKARAREEMEPTLQTSCSACLQFGQKMVAHRAELDRQIEAFRAEIHAVSVELERGRQEADAAKAAEAVRWEAEEAKAAEAEAQVSELTLLRQQVEEDEASLRDLVARVDAAEIETHELQQRHEDMSLKYQKTGEDCIGVLTELESLKKALEPLQPQAEATHGKALQQNDQLQRIQNDLVEVRNKALQEANAMREFKPKAEEMLRASDSEIRSVFAILQNLSSKHDQLTELLQKNKDNIDLVEGDVNKVKAWVQIAACPPDMHQLGEDD